MAFYKEIWLISGGWQKVIVFNTQSMFLFEYFCWVNRSQEKYFTISMIILLLLAKELSISDQQVDIPDCNDCSTAFKCLEISLHSKKMGLDKLIKTWKLQFLSSDLLVQSDQSLVYVVEKNTANDTYSPLNMLSGLAWSTMCRFHSLRVPQRLSDFPVAYEIARLVSKCLCDWNELNLLKETQLGLPYNAVYNDLWAWGLKTNGKKNCYCIVSNS